MLIVLIVIGTSIWVFIDAKSIGLGNTKSGQKAATSPAGWALFCLLLWIIGFPLYLILRPGYKRRFQAMASCVSPPPLPQGQPPQIEPTKARQKERSAVQKLFVGIAGGIGIILAIIVLVGLVIAILPSSWTASTNGDAPAGNEAAKKEAYEAKIGDHINIGNFSYVVNSVGYTKTVGNQFYQKKADGIFLVINVTFINNDKEERMLDNSLFKLTDASGNEFSSSTEGETALEMINKETLFLKECNPHISKTGLLIFEVPQESVYELHLSGGFWTGEAATVKLTGR
jgi:hypothetical protein